MADYRALYRKWRPVDFDDVCGQRAVTDILKYEVENGKISHAYLFCGSRGTGKTSCAKILAKAVNCENPRNGNPCNCCYACKSVDSGVATDVIEMDAASNNGVGNVRDMKDEIAFTPAELKYRVYIIDEVHMMSGSAFNALLKTLEEPPEYVVFILATTEFNKLPTTIVSRCQRFDFRRMTTDVIVDRLNKIARAEGIALTKDGASMLARAAEGGMRDAVSLLELCAGAGATVDEARVFETVGRGNKNQVYSMIEALLTSDYGAVYKNIADIVMLGSDLSVFWQELIDAYRDLLVVKCVSASASYLDLTDSENERLTAIAKANSQGKLLYHASVLEQTLADLQRARESKRSIAEIALTKMCDPRMNATTEALLLRIEELESTVARLKLGAGAVPKAVPKTDSIPESAEKPKAEQVTAEAPKPAEQKKPSDTAPYDKWGKVVKGIELAKPSLRSPLSKAVALKNSDGSFTVKVDAFFVRIIGENPENSTIIKSLLAEAEGIVPEDVRLNVTAKASGEGATLADELDKIIG